MKCVVGVDPSLTGTGIAVRPSGGQDIKLDTLSARNKLGHDRMKFIVDSVYTTISAYGANLVIIEGPSYGSQGTGSGHHERAGLWWMITHQVWRAGIPIAVVPPTCVKKFATGKGNAGKDLIMLEVSRRFPWFYGDNNAADALLLCAMGAQWLGEPIINMPKVHLAGLEKVKWPEEVVA